MIEAVVFVANAAVLAIEVIGGRAFTPYFGSSAEVWAGILAVVLAGLAIGYQLGGIWADRARTKDNLHRLLGSMLALSGTAILFTWPFSDTAGNLGDAIAAKTSLTMGASAVALFLLFPVSLALAAVSPIAVRLRIASLERSATAVGRLSAIAALGSVAGSFATGILLIPHYGSRETLIGIAVCLFLLGSMVMLNGEKKTFAVFALFVIGASFFVHIAFASETRVMVPGTLVADMETAYTRMWIYDTPKAPDNSFLRLVRTQPDGIQCGARMNGAHAGDASDTPIFSYTQSFDAFLYAIPHPENVLIIGGCNYSYPRHVADAVPDASVDVVEIDPRMEKMASEWFGFSPGRSITSITEDGRTFLNSNAGTESRKKYDLIFVDAYTSILSIPFQLLTKEAFADMRASLTPRGILVFNIIGTFKGPGSEYLGSVVKTLQTEFTNVHVYRLSALPDDTVQNLLVAATMSGTAEETLASMFANGKYTVAPYGLVMEAVGAQDIPKQGTVLLTDDYAPVEWLTKPLRDKEKI
ncbi:MAG: fused MFS/spermidine synthase [Patescibacteria group bacterium]|nr:fused MFS/spermidine synthase [Patescibacteria group bacterium]